MLIEVSCGNSTKYMSIHVQITTDRILSFLNLNGIISLSMSSSDLFKALRFFVVPITVMVLFFGFFCTEMFHAVSAEKHSAQTFDISESTTADCCNLSRMGHLDTWKGTFLMVTRDSGSALFLTLITSLALTVALWRPVASYTTHDPTHTRYRAYLRQFPDLNLFNQLRLAFSSGILHPKAY